ncbi:hypothetical protein, partial [Bombella saccharophila]
SKYPQQIPASQPPIITKSKSPYQQINQIVTLTFLNHLLPGRTSIMLSVSDDNNAPSPTITALGLR